MKNSLQACAKESWKRVMFVQFSVTEKLYKTSESAHAEATAQI